MALSRTFVAPAFTVDKKSRCDIKFVRWLVRKNRALSMTKKDHELNDFVDEVTDGAYNLPCVEVIFKLESCHAREDETHSEGQDTDGGEHI